MKSLYHYVMTRFWYKRLRNLADTPKPTEVLGEVMDQVTARLNYHFAQLTTRQMERVTEWIEQLDGVLNAVEFPEQHVVIAKDQPEFRPLPACRVYDPENGVNGVVVCWGLTWRQRVSLLFSGRIWHYVNNGGRNFQPTSLTLRKPAYVKPLAKEEA